MRGRIPEYCSQFVKQICESVEEILTNEPVASADAMAMADRQSVEQPRKRSGLAVGSNPTQFFDNSLIKIKKKLLDEPVAQSVEQ